MNPCQYISAFAALLAGAAIFVFCPRIRRFHGLMGFTFIFEGLVYLLDGILPLFLLSLAMLLAVPAFYYPAVRALLREDGINGKNLWMLQTAVVFSVVSIFLMNSEAGIRILPALDKAAYALYLAEYLFIQIYCSINISGYRRSLENYYSNLEERTFAPVTIVLSLMGLRLVIIAISVFIPVSVIPSWLPAVHAAVAVLFYALAAFCVCRIRYTAAELGKMALAQAEKMKEPVANDVIESRLGKLVGDKFFLDSNVNLIDIASRICVNSKYVSEYLRFHYKETFLAYVNRLRIEYSAECLKDRSLSLEEIADRSGFSNVSTYYRNFTKIMGVPPSKYRDSQQ